MNKHTCLYALLILVSNVYTVLHKIVYFYRFLLESGHIYPSSHPLLQQKEYEKP